jgi:hypothetical protein
MVSNKERAVGSNWQLLSCVRRKLIYAKIIHCFLQFAVTVLGTEDAALLNANLAKTDVERTAPLPSITGEASGRMSPQYSFQVSSAQFLHPWRLGLNYHPFGDRGGTWKQDLTTHFYQAKLASPIRHFFG